ncbi:MAG: SGNH/GDSL hydrolase family protein [Candidatus Levyibacteriota bacterium]
MDLSELEKYIQHVLRQGISREEIARLLQSHGWENWHIEKAFHNIHHKSPQQRVKRFFKAAALFLAFFFATSVIYAFFFFVNKPVQVSDIPKKPQALTVVSLMHQPTPTAVPTHAAIPTAATLIPHEVTIPTPTPIVATHYIVACFGDSMIDTMGETLPYLSRALSQRFPTVSFSFYNYGIGAQNVEMGLDRFDSPFDYQDRHYKPITQIGANAIVIGSFSYNPFDPFDRTKHLQLLSSLITKAKAVTPNVYLLAEIAPLPTLAKGPKGVPQWDDSYRLTRATEISEELADTVSLATTLNIPLVNVYQATLASPSSLFGNAAYINTDDMIHPSVEGHVLTADKIANAIALQ